MKRTTISLLFIVCLLLLECTQQKKYADYSAGSGFDRKEIDSLALQNLEILGRVWGFVKYHHPAFSESNYDLDYELFELLPLVTDVTPAVRNELLGKWVDSFGEYETIPERYEMILASDSIASHCTDVEWIRDTTKLGRKLSDRLVNLRYAHRKGNYYVAKTRKVYNGVAHESQNPDFRNEKSYAYLSRPDCGYRLLAVFRFWNMVEYFYPSKYLTDKNWDEVLPEYILRMVYLQAGNYSQEVWRMITELNDGHAQGGNSLLFGQYRVPLNVGLVEGKLVVITPDTVSITHERRAPFHVGDEIVAVDGKPIDYYVAQVREFVPCSNENCTHTAAADIVLRTQSEKQLPIRYRRNEMVKDSLADVEVMFVGFKQAYLSKNIVGAKMLDNSIGYIYPAKYKYPNRPILDILNESKGLIIDMRCYPTSEFASFMGNYIIPDSIEDPFRMTYPAIELPGVFYSKSYSWGTSKNRKYPFPVMLLVDSNTQSYAETSVQWMQKNPNVMVIGSQSAGANGNCSDFTLPANISSCFSGLGWYYPDGWVVNRQGVKIDLDVQPTIQGIKVGRDEALETAIQIINAKTCRK